MPRQTRRRWVVAFIALVLSMSACGDDQSESNGRVSDTASKEPATPRGLAAAVLAHLQKTEVTYIGGNAYSDDPATNEESVSVAVATQGSVRSLSIHAQPAASAFDPTECGRDANYRSVVCVTEPHFLEVGVRKRPKPDHPLVEGWYYGESRGGVVVQAFGSDRSAAQRLVREVLEDSLVGAETSPSMNRAGEELTEFKKLKTRIILR